MRPIAVTRVCVDYDSYFKIGPNDKKKNAQNVMLVELYSPLERHQILRLWFLFRECMRPNDWGLFLWDETHYVWLPRDDCRLLLQVTDASL